MEYIDFADDNFNSWTVIPPITFSSLRRLKLLVVDPYTIVGTGLRWATHFLRSIDTPGLQQLIVISPTEYTVNTDIVEQLVEYISIGHAPSRATTSEHGPPRKSLYPELRYFGIFFPLPKGTRLYKSESLLAALPLLTHLRILGEDIDVLDRRPQCSPILVCLSIRSPVLSTTKLGDVLRRRQEAGFAIHTVALQDGEDASGLSSVVKLKTYDRSEVFEFLDL
ncbi:hypothetical protein FRC11_003029 [Ceratobasidium sp. 423]|nr:hypothetical protein FRC11_003029 [Ceratobasidium sp. 423]